jgi:hypothetical protein
MRNAQKVLVWKSEWKIALWKLRCRWESDTISDIKSVMMWNGCIWLSTETNCVIKNIIRRWRNQVVSLTRFRCERLIFLLILPLLLSLAPQPSLGLGLLHKIQLNFLKASKQFSFYRVGLLAPRPTPIPEDQASVFIFPRGRMATHFSRLLRYAWVTVGLFLVHVHHTGNNIYYLHFYH